MSPVVHHRSDLRAAADELFRTLSPYDGDGLRNHCLRLHAFVDMMLRRAGCPMDRDLAYAVAMIHDHGLLTEIGRAHV